MLGDPRSDLRRVQDLPHLTPESFDHFGHVSPSFDEYLHGRADLYLEFGIRTGDPNGEACNYGATLQSRAFDRVPPVNGNATCERYVGLGGLQDSDSRMEFSVLVIIRESGETDERIVGGIQSRVVLVPILDPASDCLVYSRQPSADVSVEQFGRVVDRKLDGVLGALVWEWPARSVTYQLPGNVVEDGAVVVKDVSEPCRERGREFGNTLVDHEPSAIDVSDCEPLVAFWLDLEGWVWVTVEEPAYLAPRDGAMCIAPSKLDLRAAEGELHAR